MQTSLWLLSFFHFFLLQASVLFVLLNPTLSPHLRPQTSNPITHCFVRTHWIWFFIYTDSGWTPLSVEFLLVLDGTVRRAQQEGSRPRWCLLFISRWELFLFSQFSQHISLLGLQLRGAHMKRRRVIQMILCLSLVSLRVYIFLFFIFLSVKKWKAFQGLICPIVHLLLTKVYSLLLAQHLPWILAITFPLEDAFVM